MATRFRSSGETFFLRGLTGRRCSGDAVEADEMSRVAERFDGLGMFWHRAVAGGVRRGSAGSTAHSTHSTLSNARNSTLFNALALGGTGMMSRQMDGFKLFGVGTREWRRERGEVGSLARGLGGGAGGTTPHRDPCTHAPAPFAVIDACWLACARLWALWASPNRAKAATNSLLSADNRVGALGGRQQSGGCPTR